MSEIAADHLLETRTVAIHDVRCRGSHRHESGVECASGTHLVFPYRGVYVRHVGREQAVAEANQVLFFNADEAYRVSHPVADGPAEPSLPIGEKQLPELAPRSMLQGLPATAFKTPTLVSED